MLFRKQDPITISEEVIISVKELEYLRQAEKNFKSLRARLQHIFSTLDSSFWGADIVNHKMLYVSRGNEKVYGYTEEEFLSNPDLWYEVIIPEDKSKGEEVFVRAAKGEPVTSEYRIQHRDKSIRWIETRLTPTLDASGTLILIDGITVDITERKKEEAFRTEIERNLNEAQKLSKTGSFEFNLDTHELFWSKEHYRIFEMEETSSDKLWEVCRQKIHPEDISKLDAAIDNAVKNGKAVNLEHRIVCSDGSVKHLYGVAEVYKNGDGENMLRGSVQDVTELKKSEQLLAQSEYNLRAIVDAEPECVKVLNREGQVLEINPAGLAMMEADDLKQVRGQKVIDLINPEYRDAFSGLCADVFKGKSGRLDFVMTGLKGTELWLETNAVPMRDEEGRINALLSVTRDITERRKAEEELKLNEQRLLEAQKVARIGDYSYDFATNIWKCSPVLDEITGLGPDEILIFENWIALITPDVKEEITGKIFPLIDTGTFPAGHYLDCKIKRANDGEERWVSILGELERDKSGKAVRLKGTVQDITERKNAEEEIRRLNESLERKVEERTAELQLANRELEAFNYSVSHDLQSPLRSLSGFSNILVNDYGDKLDDLGKEYLHIINRSSKKMSLLVKALLDFARLGKAPLTKAETNMSKLVSSVVEDLKIQQAGIKAAFILNSVDSAFCDERLMRQVWENLISNAIKYSSKKDNPTIEVGMKETEGKRVYFVKDNGAGFDMKLADKLFGVFQRVHSASEFEGTGIGLATVERIIAKHDGKIWTESAVDEGAVFYFTLP